MYRYQLTLTRVENNRVWWKVTHTRTTQWKIRSTKTKNRTKAICWKICQPNQRCWENGGKKVFSHPNIETQSNQEKAVCVFVRWIRFWKNHNRIRAHHCSRMTFRSACHNGGCCHKTLRSRCLATLCNPFDSCYNEGINPTKKQTITCINFTELQQKTLQQLVH